MSTAAGPDGSEQVGFGGGCHWCTEAVFQSIPEVLEVKQGWLRSIAPNQSWSEGVLVSIEPGTGHLAALIEAHLMTHASQSQHPLRQRYRSAIYTFGLQQQRRAELILQALQEKFTRQLITQVVPFDGFRLSATRYQNYYATSPDRPFCQTHIEPKLRLLAEHRKPVSGSAATDAVHETPGADQ